MASQKPPTSSSSPESTSTTPPTSRSEPQQQHPQQPPPAPAAKDKFSFLQALTSAEEYHGDKSFYQHLLNVYTFLRSQSLPDEVCNAGLFHSVYGTENYHFRSEQVTREVVRGYIGQYAEELVFLFCGLRSDRFGCILHNTPGWAPRQHLDLCRLEYANFWDGREDRDVGEQMRLLGQTMARLEKGD
ncbi:hypothetical protein E4U41_005793 [Claviceps citrina]|nr:hypothetical protein E4U41_005793 [Claviceps citrina]